MKGASLTEGGILFQSLGAATAKARSPLSLKLVHETVKSPRSANLRGLEVE